MPQLLRLLLMMVAVMQYDWLHLGNLYGAA
jgi:hypothetical protein